MESLSLYFPPQEYSNSYNDSDYSDIISKKAEEKNGFGLRNNDFNSIYGLLRFVRNESDALQLNQMGIKIGNSQ